MNYSLSLDLSNNLEDIPIGIEANVSEEEYPVFQYSPDNVQGPGCVIDPSEVTLPGCSCHTHSCLTDSCCCLQTYGQAYNSSCSLLDLSSADAAYSMPVFECNTLCACSEACSNRVVQKGITLRLEVYLTKERGWALRTLEPIPSRTFVCEYAGEVISFEEAMRRQLAQRLEDNNYIIAVREHAGQGPVSQTFVDPCRVGNVGRFLNHSCLPNLFMVPVRVHSVVPRLALFASRDIDGQEELTFDYAGGSSSQPHVEQPMQRDAAIQASRTATLQRKPCNCGAQNCARFLPLDISVLSI